MKSYRFDLSKKKNCSIQSFAVRETNGDDEDAAATQKVARGGNATVFEELVRLSITHVNDQRAEQPLLMFDGWNSRTRNYVLQAFRSINGVDDKDMDDFLAGGVPYDGSMMSANVAGSSG